MKVTSQLNQRAFALLVLSIASPWEQGALATEASETASYDFIIVGGGTAGLALASRLSEYSTQSILVLETGPAPDIIGSYRIPGASGGVLGSIIDYAFTTTPQTYLDGRTLAYNRGRALGGSSAINLFSYGRGSKSVFDLWESLGNPGWGWDSVFPLFKKSSTFNPTKAHGPYETFNPDAYSDGPLQVTYPEFQLPVSSAFVESMSSIGVDVVEDLNLGNNVGAKQEPFTIDANMQRSSSYDNYYGRSKHRSNLHVWPLSPVQRVVFEQVGDDLVATGVIYTDARSGSTRNATATKEVILSAGSLHTPQLLMLSGIGPNETLPRYGLGPPYVVNENVGQKMQDHVYFSVIARTNRTTSTESVLDTTYILQEAQEQWMNNRTGPLTVTDNPSFAFQKIPEDDLRALNATELLEDRADQAHIEYLFETDYYPPYPGPRLTQYPPLITDGFISITAALIAPVSRGSITLQSPLPNDPPVIDPNYYSAATDRALAIYGFKKARTILADPRLSAFTVGPDNGEVVPGTEVQTDEEILQFIKDTSVTVWHAAGTCAMLPEDKGGVVDGRLRVYGVKNLRIADLSITPIIPDQHTSATAYMIAEKAAELIIEDWKLD